MAPAFPLPPLDAVSTTPRCFLADAHLVRGRVGGKVLAVDREANVAALLDGAKAAGKRHLPERAVMAVGLGVGRDVHEFGAVSPPGERAHQSPGKPLTIGEEVAERNVTGDYPVVEEESDAPPGREPAEIRYPGIDPAAGDVRPVFLPDLPHTCRLVRGEDGEPDPCRRQRFKRPGIGRCLREPHPLRLPAEPCRKIADTPGNLGPPVPRACKRHDDVVVAAGDCRAVTAVVLPALSVAIKDRTVDLRMLLLKPGEKRRCGRETDLRIDVDDIVDQAVRIEDTRSGVRGVALRGHPLVPVVKRGSGTLDLDAAEPGVLPRWLVEVAVNADGTIHRHAPSGAKMTAPSGGRVSGSDHG